MIKMKQQKSYEKPVKGELKQFALDLALKYAHLKGNLFKTNKEVNGITSCFKSPNRNDLRLMFCMIDYVVLIPVTIQNGATFELYNRSKEEMEEVKKILIDMINELVQKMKVYKSFKTIVEYDRGSFEYNIVDEHQRKIITKSSYTFE
jgi:hypothetical protein